MPKSGVYEIARFIPLKIRRQMVAVKYAGHAPNRAPRCKDGKCPMGWLPGLDAPTPLGGTVAEWVEQYGLASGRTREYRELAGMAWDFIDDWDGRRIKNLRKALGVPK